MCVGCGVWGVGEPVGTSYHTTVLDDDGIGYTKGAGTKLYRTTVAWCRMGNTAPCE